MIDYIDLISAIAGKGGTRSNLASKNAKFDASIITTYNAYLPFYEDVILRRLVASGCQHNILLLDGNYYARSISSPTAMPRFAGRSYTLIPMHVPGVFHPKVALLVGKKRVRVIVGSHNMTLSGYGYNRELSTVIDLSHGSEDPNAPLAQEFWRFIEILLEQNKDYIPSSIIDSTMRVAINFSKWLRQDSTQTGNTRLYGTTPNGISLWDRIRPGLPSKAKKVTIIGPFFDKNGEFLHTLVNDLQPNEVVVGIEPDKVELCRIDDLPPQVRFIDIGKLGNRLGYLHAKAIFIEGSNGEFVLITGSANPSKPAWLGTSSKRNAEVVILHSGTEAYKLAQELGLINLSLMTNLSNAILNDISQRNNSSQNSQNAQVRHTVFVAEALQNEIHARLPGLTNDNIELVQFSKGNHEDWNTPDSANCDEDGLHIYLKSADINNICLVEVRLVDGHILTGFVHHPSLIAKHARTSSQQRFCDALNSLNSDSPDLPTLIRLASGLIFEENISNVSQVGTASQKEKHPLEDQNSILGSLSISVDETKQKRNLARDLRGGDLTFIIDSIIYRLGQGLSDSTEQLENKGPTEEEQVGVEEEQQDVIKEDSQFNLVYICNSKIKTLVNRMLKHINKARKDDPEAHKIISRLLAVLAVLREVRAQDNRLLHLLNGQSLVSEDQRGKLLAGAVEILFGRNMNLFDTASKYFENDIDDDLSRLLGLLLWLAWDSGLDARICFDNSDWNTEKRRERIIELAKLLEILYRGAKYEDSFNEAENSAWRTCKEASRGSISMWIEYHKKLAYCLSNYLLDLSQVKVNTIPQPGDLAVALKETHPKLRVVLSVAKETVHMIEFGDKDNEVAFSQEFLISTSMPIIDS